MCGFGLLAPGAGAQGLNEFEIDVPRPLKGSLELKQSNEVKEVELALDAGYRQLLGKQKSPRRRQVGVRSQKSPRG